MPHGSLKIVSVGDLHFGNPRIDAEELYLKLRKYLYPQLKDTQLVTVDGDIYDQLLVVNSKSYKYATLFIRDLFNFSAATGAQIRLLHGTFSHDRDQLSIFDALARPATRYKIINQIEVEEIEDLRYKDEVVKTSLKVGYLPDNLSYREATDVVEHLKRSMTVVGWNTLDMLVGHGTFEHTIPANNPHRPPITYTKEMFENIVKGIIVMGHIHTPSRKWNIYYAGSFDRMAHGEEEDKGFYVFTRDEANKEGWRSEFIVNKMATPFITIEPTGNDVPLLITNFIETLKQKFPRLSGFVRVAHKDPEIRAILHKVCAQQFPGITFSSKSLQDDGPQELKIAEISLDVADDVKPNEKNLGELIYQFMEEHDDIKEVTKDEILKATASLILEGK